MNTEKKWTITDFKGRNIFDVKKINDEVRITLSSDKYQIDRWFDKDEFNIIFREMEKIHKEINK
ncbi:MAG: hypothetical protein IJH39_05140 [Clostridia bacterium]|nr:hypothetical protein [Clostridia bacterium]